VLKVTMDRPPVNAVNQAMYREIKRLFEEIGDDRSVDVVILAGEGKHFCAGNDLDEFKTLDPENSGERMREVREAFWAIHDCPVPVIAAVQGTAVGTGLAIIASCDFAVASEDARIGVTEISVGVMGAAKHLARLLPQPVVRSLFFTGDPIPAADFERLGGLVAVVPREELLDEAQRWAEKIARHSPRAIRYAKRALNEIESMDLKPGYEFEQGLTGELSGYPDSKEALAAFFERRPPRYERGWDG
jgi:enoyl-CoA hydratase